MPRTDEDVLRDLLHRAAGDLRAPAAVSAGIVGAHQRRLRNTRLLSIATTTVAAAAMAGAVIITRVGPPARKAPSLPAVKLTALQVLDRLSVAAAHAAQPAGRYVTLTASIQGGVNYQQMTVFDSVTGDIWVYQHGSSNKPGSRVPSELPPGQHASPTKAQFSTWPTNPVKLRALLLSPREQATPEGRVLAGGIKGETPDDMVFMEATGWLWNPLLSPALRSAMYKVLARTPGVLVKAGTTDEAGQPAIEISRTDSATGERLTTFENPSTGAVLQQGSTLWGDSGTAVYTSVTSSATLPPNPYPYNAG